MRGWRYLLATALALATASPALAAPLAGCAAAPPDSALSCDTAGLVDELRAAVAGLKGQELRKTELDPRERRQIEDRLAALMARLNPPPSVRTRAASAPPPPPPPPAPARPAPVVERPAAPAMTASPLVIAALREASRDTGVSFAFLARMARRESNFDPLAKAPGSTALGLFQFTEQTWLQLMRSYGAQYGYPYHAAAILPTGDNSFTVADPRALRAILDLRTDPRLSAILAAEYARENAAILDRELGRRLTGTDIYLAHFLGPAGAVQFLKAYRDNGYRAAAQIVPAAARANPGIFYGRDGQEPRTALALYDLIRRDIDG